MDKIHALFSPSNQLYIPTTKGKAIEFFSFSNIKAINLDIEICYSNNHTSCSRYFCKWTFYCSKTSNIYIFLCKCVCVLLTYVDAGEAALLAQEYNTNFIYNSTTGLLGCNCSETLKHWSILQYSTCILMLHGWLRSSRVRRVNNHYVQ